jgi:hypothetical protein
MKKIIIIITLVIVALAGVVYYWQWTHSPKYSLMQAKEALENHDIISFEKYVDVQSLTERLIDQLLDFSSEQKEQPSNERSQMYKNFAKGFISLLKPQFAKMAKEQVSYYVEKGSFENENDKDDNPKFSLKEIWNKSGGEKSEFRGYEYVKKDGKIALVGLSFFYHEYNTKLVLDIKMREKDGYWQVAELSNFSNYMKKLDELESKRIEELNMPIIENIEKSLVLENITKSTFTDSWGLNKKVIFKIDFKNCGDQVIDKYKAVLICKDSDGKVLKKIVTSDEDDINPGQTGGGIWESDVNMFISTDNTLYETPQERLSFDVQIQYLKFADGSELKLHKKYEQISSNGSSSSPQQ